MKYGLISDAGFYTWLTEHMPALLAREEAALAEAIERSCAIKAEVVAQDERESGIRAILNLGHTFGHAIETGKGYGEWLHGEAVAVGMVLALELSARRGWIEHRAVDDLRALLATMQLPVAPPDDMSAAQFLELMARDKKVIDGRMRFILVREIGMACIVDDATDAEISGLF